MKLTRSLFAATVLMAVAAPAFAQLNANQTTSTDRLQLVSSAPFSPYGTYTGRLLQSIGTPVIDMWCDDFTHNISSTPFNINVTRFDASEGEFDGNTRFGYANLANYKKAAYLTQFFTGLTNLADVKALHQTIWHLFNPNQPGTTLLGEATWAAKLTGGQWNNINTRYWFVLSDTRMTGDNLNGPQALGSQEQLTNVVPEPSAILLVSTGLLGIVGLVRVRRRGKKQG